MWNLVRIQEELNKLSREWDDTFSIPVKLNGRLSTTLGRVFHVTRANGLVEPTRMEFSKKFVESGTDEEIVAVIKHEWAHYYITKETGEQHGHDKHFKALCAKIGTNGKTSFKLSNTEETKSKKYEMFCTCCGKNLGGYSRMCKTLKQIDAKAGILSKCCRSEVRYEQNW